MKRIILMSILLIFMLHPQTEITIKTKHLDLRYSSKLAYTTTKKLINLIRNHGAR